MFQFEKLDVWQYARSFARDVYGSVESFPRKEQFALTQQLQRAVVSISANIAEGSSRSSAKEFSRYVEMAYGSLCEVVAELFIALDCDYLKEDDFKRLYAQSESLGRMMSRFREALETSWIKTTRSGDHQTIKPSNHQTRKGNQ
jgi:four helix bundle protein